MNTLGAWRFGAAAALTFSIVYTVCALAVALFPDGTIGFFNYWFHGLDLRLLKPPEGRPLTIEQFFGGLVSVAIVSYATGSALAGFYNALARRRAEVVHAKARQV
jgi:hypothetical protein